MKASLYVAILVVALTIAPILSCTVMAQSAGFDLNSCQQNCAWLRPYGRNYGQYMNYYDCMARCQSQFWKDFDSNSRKLEKELK
jgi:hypothetical protein